MHARLTLPQGWIEVKPKLKVLDKKHQHAYSVDGVSSDGKTYRFNVVKHQIATAAIRITAWGLTGEDGKPIPYPTGRPFEDRVAAIEQLDEEMFEAITEALDAHVRTVEADHAEGKAETPVGGTPSGASLPSAS